MRPEEVLKILNSPFDEHPGSLEEATKTIIQALEKQVAKKPIRLIDPSEPFSLITLDVNLCGECEEKLKDNWKGCPHCLTVIDWSEEK